jgi:hypothetical protein
MRTLILLCVVALVAACGVAYFVGLVEVGTEHPDGKYVVSLTVNTAMLHHNASVAEPSAVPRSDTPNDSLAVTGKINTVRPDNNEVVVSENFQSWTFQLAKDGKVFINNRESKLADLQAGDDAIVTFDRLGSLLVASVIRSMRK